MGILNEQELAAIAATPALAAVAEKLKTLENMIPQSRFNEVTTEKQRIADELAAIKAAQQKAEDDRALKNGEVEKLLTAEKARAAALEASLATEKQTADQFRAFRAEQIEATKKILGDKWLPEYESFSLASLAKIVPMVTGKPPASPDTHLPGGGPPKKDVNAMSSPEFLASVEQMKRGVPATP